MEFLGYAMIFASGIALGFDNGAFSFFKWAAITAGFIIGFILIKEN